MRKLTLIALMASISFLGFSSVASATSVGLAIVGTAAGGAGIFSSTASSVTLNVSGSATLTVDVQVDIDSRGLAGLFMSLKFDTDGENEVNVVSFTELSWAFVNMMGATTSELGQLTTGINSTQESAAAVEGQLYTFEGQSLGTGPANTTLTFARVVFSTNSANVATDGDDIFSGTFFPGEVVGCNSPGCDITSSVSFGGIAVNLVPEPGTISLLGLGIGALVLAGGRRGRK